MAASFMDKLFVTQIPARTTAERAGDAAERAYDDKDRHIKRLQRIVVALILLSTITFTVLAFADDKIIYTENGTYTIHDDGSVDSGSTNANDADPSLIGHSGETPAVGATYDATTGKWSSYTKIKDELDAQKAIEEHAEQNDPLVAIFKPVVNMLIKASRELVSQTASQDLLLKGFKELVTPSGTYDIFKDVHKNAAIPIANVIATVVFVIGLIKLFANQSSAEAGIDLWKVIMVFICYAGTLAVINASWEIMEGMYALALNFIQDVHKYATAAAGAAPVTELGEDIKSASTVIVMLIIALLMLLVAVVCTVIINVMITVRGLEIYLYTVFSPIAAAFLVTEGGRQMTETFAKRYLAVLLAGAIQMLLLILLNFMIPSVGTVPTGTPDDTAAYIAQYLLSFVGVVVVAWMMTRSTSVARDLIGVS